MFAEIGTLGPGFYGHHVVTKEAEQCWEAWVGWEWMRLLSPLPPSLSDGVRLRIHPWVGSYCRANTGSVESLKAGFLRETQGMGIWLCLACNARLTTRRLGKPTFAAG